MLREKGKEGEEILFTGASRGAVSPIHAKPSHVVFVDMYVYMHNVRTSYYKLVSCRPRNFAAGLSRAQGCRTKRRSSPVEVALLSPPPPPGPPSARSDSHV